ncbi:M23 family metallopeptidase [Alteribacillus iranensis]|uniref:Stage II sporulation protein Q n=1 Tax=Alteribacillus iranensis TaxID=930128 RepID=A0A1I2BY74_9BACI|nr:M23 family metallopeptidase [Alteribacillus iranensis]SFE61081.1 stage II sporulation protein Q [Alteribacillus iranensis]
MKDEEKQHSAKRSITKKSWFWPAAYLSAAAVILGTYFMIQSPAGTDQAEEGTPSQDEEWNSSSDDWEANEDAMPTASGDETVEMPVVDEESVDIIGYYYDHDAAAEEQQDALVYYNNMYYQNKGIDIAGKDGETFEVAAAVTGEVIRAEKDSILGYVVEVKHEDNIVTSYSSLEDLRVEEGDTITQGSILGMAGRNQYNSDAGIHAHFEIRKDGEPMDPTDAFHQKLKELEKKEEDEKQEEEKQANEEEDSNQDNADEEDQEEEQPLEDPLADNEEDEETSEDDDTETEE